MSTIKFLKKLSRTLFKPQARSIWKLGARWASWFFPVTSTPVEADTLVQQSMKFIKLWWPTGPQGHHQVQQLSWRMHTKQRSDLKLILLVAPSGLSKVSMLWSLSKLDGRYDHRVSKYFSHLKFVSPIDNNILIVLQ